MIRFRETATLSLFPNNGAPEEIERNFKQGEVVEANIFDAHDDLVDIEYGDGFLSTDVPRDIIEVIS